MLTRLITNLQSNGKTMMIFSGICAIAGICWYIFFNGIENYVQSQTHPVILEFMTETVGRMGMTAFFGGAGLLIFFRGLMRFRQDKKQQAEANDPFQSKFRQ